MSTREQKLTPELLWPKRFIEIVLANDYLGDAFTKQPHTNTLPIALSEYLNNKSLWMKTVGYVGGRVARV